jgi:hypothetical protein
MSKLVRQVFSEERFKAGQELELYQRKLVRRERYALIAAIVIGASITVTVVVTFGLALAALGS